ncbi:hypothetical protein J6590_043008 [Homalodisca vitripennis]|nr:hypothetical protein J6590_043008 [Homalodisca vitripennis]
MANPDDSEFEDFVTSIMDKTLVSEYGDRMKQQSDDDEHPSRGMEEVEDLALSPIQLSEQELAPEPTTSVTLTLTPCKRRRHAQPIQPRPGSAPTRTRQYKKKGKKKPDDGYKDVTHNNPDPKTSIAIFNLNKDKRQSRRPAKRPKEERLTGWHFLRQRDKKWNRCVVCKKKGLRRETTYVCKTCPNEPALHPDECFEVYHTKQNF